MGVRDGARPNGDAALSYSRHKTALRLGHAIPGAARRMNASYEWLREFVPFGLTPEELRDLLTSRVATVDDLIRLRADLDAVVVARVVEAAAHPDSDHLWVTKVDAGKGALLDVVCGASNVEVGALYPFAAVGTTLPGGLKLEKKKIRGAVSEGMLL